MTLKATQGTRSPQTKPYPSPSPSGWRRPWPAFASRSTFAAAIMASLTAMAKEKSEQINAVRTISVIGQGQVSEKPDRISFVIGVQVTEPTPQKAIETVKRKISAIIAIAGKHGIQASGIQSDYVSLHPVNGPGSGTERSTIGSDSYKDQQKKHRYRASSDVKVTLENLDIYETLTSALFAEGANKLHSLNFTSSQTEQLKERARLKALENAKTKAKIIAKTMGLKLGGALHISEAGAIRPSAGEWGNRTALSLMASSSHIDRPFNSVNDDGESLAPGEITIKDRISVIFSAEP